MIAVLCASAMMGVALTLAGCLSRSPSPGPAKVRARREGVAAVPARAG